MGKSTPPWQPYDPLNPSPFEGRDSKTKGTHAKTGRAQRFIHGLTSLPANESPHYHFDNTLQNTPALLSSPYPTPRALLLKLFLIFRCIFIRVMALQFEQIEKLL
jgi:hypothetical protein